MDIEVDKVKVAIIDRLERASGQETRQNLREKIKTKHNKVDCQCISKYLNFYGI